MTRSLRALLLTPLGVLAATVPAPAGASITPPRLSLPAYTQGFASAGGSVLFYVHWLAPGFSPTSAQDRQDALITDLDGPGHPEFFLSADATVLTGAAPNGHRYRLDLFACTGASCLVNPPANRVQVTGTSRVDQTPPHGAMVINGDAPFTNSRDVTLNLSATDPPIGFDPASASGVSEFAVDPDGNGSFVCTTEILGGAVDNTGCGQTFTDTGKATLPPGDGPKTVGVEFGDGARPVVAPCTNPLCAFPDFSIKGNLSAPVTDTIVLDTTKPIGLVTPGTVTVPQGGVVTLNSAASTDPGASASGIDASSSAWDFKDGTPVVTGGQVTHTFTAAGTFTGLMVVKDRAGNASDASPFTVNVTPTTSGGGGQTTGGQSGGQTGGTTRLRPLGLTLNLAGRGRLITVSGVLRLPAGATCAGVVRLTVRRGHTAKLVRVSLAPKKGACVFSTRLRGGSGMRVSARFAGSASLTPLSGPAKRV